METYFRDGFSSVQMPPKPVSIIQRIKCKNPWKSSVMLPLPRCSSSLSNISLLSVVNLTPIVRTSRLTVSRVRTSFLVSPSSSLSSDPSHSLLSQKRKISRNSFTSGIENFKLCASLASALSSAVSCCLRIMRASCTNSHSFTHADPSSVVSSTPASRAKARARSKRPQISSCSSAVDGAQPNSRKTSCNSSQSMSPLPSLSKRLNISRILSISVSENPALLRSCPTLSLCSLSARWTKLSKSMGSQEISSMTSFGGSLWPHFDSAARRCDRGSLPDSRNRLKMSRIWRMTSIRCNCMSRRNSRKFSSLLRSSSTMRIKRFNSSMLSEWPK
mmetsp:Transcript_13191/g.22717  ORF Transcript_13191/g.22717 Transcript_13191/m.22717 type:complete len:331 (+) Transcript_13191:55-1047(+)